MSKKPDAWRRMEFGNWEYAETEFYDAMPLYHLSGNDLDAIRRAAVVIRDAGYEDALAAQLEAIVGGER